MTFAADLARFVEKAGRNADAVVRNVTLEAANSVIEMSPVDTGRFRANWQHGSGAANLATREAVDPSGQQSKSRIAGSAAAVKAGGVEYITNNLPYAQALENGHSQQAPAGMVGVTLRSFTETVNRAVNQAKSKRP